MFKIGIIGSDNSHADAFAQLVNLPDENGVFAFPDFKITSIFGLEKSRTEEVAEKGKIETIVEKPEDMMGKVDAVMVVFRHGDLHLKYALPFIEAGIPTWIDKPLTITNEDAVTIIEAARKHNTLITGGSSLKYVYDVLMIEHAVKKGSRVGRVQTAVVNFPATLQNIYGGIYFYGHHLIELTLKGFGYNPKSVLASECNGCVAAILKYDNYQVTMNFIHECREYFAILHGEKGTFIREIDIHGCYDLEFGAFARMMRTREPVESYEHLYAPVEVMNAVVESMNSKKEVEIKGLQLKHGI